MVNSPLIRPAISGGGGTGGVPLGSHDFILKKSKIFEKEQQLFDLSRPLFIGFLRGVVIPLMFPNVS